MLVEIEFFFFKHPSGTIYQKTSQAAMVREYAITASMNLTY